jgi:hypothetical protein
VLADTNAGLVSYADFVLVGFLRFTQCAGHDILDRVVEMEPAFGVLYGASTKWLLRDDH